MIRYARAAVTAFRVWTLLLAAALLGGCATTPAPRGTGDLGLVVQRADGRVSLVDASERAELAEIDGLGDLSHASAVFSRDERFAYVFGRDGALTKVDLLRGRIVARVQQAGNSIGGAISGDGRLVAVSNYEPGGVRVFDARTLEPVARIPARYGDGERARVVGLVDAPGERFVFSLYEAGEIWIADFSGGDEPSITRIRGVGRKPYDGLITPEGRYYIAGLFGEDGLALVDLWHPERGAREILAGYGRGEKRLPVYKMPHLEGWAMVDDYALLPAVGRHEVLVVDRDDWHEVARIPVHGQPVFVMAGPDGREAWVNFAFPRNDTVQVIDMDTLKVDDTLTPGRGVLHIAFSARGEEVWLSLRDDDAVAVYDADTHEPLARLPVPRPSGIFFTDRADRIGL
ncbi:hypothetical protein KBTX_02041 [wastewater metagenome]|uniref:Protein nirF n=2 Tax=unclassified sequences TaxID=12908 RepID=A0A5B8RGA5_9ZZZZ|nr:hypothetical protein KBTEX_02041 [uncultured organism]